MRRNFKFILVLILTASLTISAYAGDKILKSEKWGFKFSYPSTWKGKTIPSSTDLVKGSINKDNKTGMQIRLYANRKGNFKSFVNWYVKDFIKQMEGHWGGKIKIVGKSYKKIGKHDGCTISLDFKRADNKRYFFKQYLWPKGNKVYVIQSGTPYSLRYANEPAMDSIAESFDSVK